MPRTVKLLELCYNLSLSPAARERADHYALVVAISAFFLHLVAIFLVDRGLISAPIEGQLLTDPIAATYTPFSFILVYEVYLLIFYLPYSITVYVGKQYEIITLIIIRRIFKDLANIELSADWFQNRDDLILTADITASVLLFGLIYFFNRLGGVHDAARRADDGHEHLDEPVRRFIRVKKFIATCLVPVLFAMALWSFAHWAVGVFSQQSLAADKFKDINNIFFEDFFKTLIIVDVLLLLLSLFITDEFHKVIRNSGFIISTILIRLSFSVDGLVSTTLVVFAVAFGLLVLWIHNCYANLEDSEQKQLGSK